MIMIITGLIFMAIGSVFAWLVMQRKQYKGRSNVYIDYVRQEFSRDSNSWGELRTVPILNFYYKGKQYRVEGHWNGIKRGTNVVVHFNTENPNKCYIEGDNSLNIGVIVFLGVGVLFTFIGIFMGI